MRIPILIVGLAFIPDPILAQQQVVADLPEVRGPFTLTAVYDSAAGHNAFAYRGKTVPPVVRVLPGGVIRVHYVNDLPEKSNEECAIGPCHDMTNLHFHGLHVSPNRPQDDVLTMMAGPRKSLDYSVVIPPYAPPGLYWYHTHPHGESNEQDLDGMSGAIVVEGIENYYPQVRRMRERVLVLRDLDIARADSAIRTHVVQQVGIPSVQCGSAKEQRPGRVFTVNGQLRPRIPISPGERQFWRIVNASPDRYADLRVTGEKLEIVALDGMPLSYHNRHSTPLTLDHLLLPPAGRVEAIVSGPRP